MKTSRGVLFAGLVCAALTLAPAAAFAQHGGGGGGGHSGGGGGGHFGGGGSAHPSSAPASASHGSAPASHGNTSASGAGNTANPTGGGHWWSPSHGAANASEKTPAQLATHNVVGANSASGITTVRPAVGRIFSPTRPGYGGYYPYYPYYYPYYGYGGLFFGSAFGPCDPFWGCNGFGYGFGGYGFGLGYGYGGGGYYGGGYSGGSLFGTSDAGGEPGWTYPSNNGGDSNGDYTVNAQGSNGDANANVSTSDAGEASPSLGTSAPTTVLRNDAAPAPAAKPNTVLYLRDGSSFAVTDYWLAEGRLHYVTSYGGENTMDVSKLDLQKSVDENAKTGNAFSLKSMPDAQK
jgi:hypothetical protein